MAYYSDIFKDRDGNELEVKWTKKTWDFHLSKHLEIENFRTASYLITNALLKPSLVMLGKNVGERKETIRCYYKEHKQHQGKIYYTKVVARCNRIPFRVKTVWKEWLIWEKVVKEEQYSNFKEIWKDPKTYL